MTRSIPALAMTALALLAAPPSSAEAPCATGEASFSEAYRQVSPSVVRILSLAIDPFSLRERVRIGSGSGLVLDEAGHVVTNAHVVYEARDLLVSSGDHDMQPAKILGLDPISDLAVLRPVDPKASTDLTVARLGDGEDLAVGTEVLAVGFPFGFDKTATQGIISGTRRVLPLSPLSWLTPLLQTDAALSPGNSGGPLVDLCGTVVGLNTLAGSEGQNLNFAIPIDIVRALAAEIVAEGRVIRPWHGIHGQMVPPALVFTIGIPPGFMVETIEPGSPAERIGLLGGSLPVAIGMGQYLLGGDVIVRVNGEILDGMATVARIARNLKVGDTVKLDYLRDGELLSAEVVLPERPILPADLQRLRQRRALGFGD